MKIISIIICSRKEVLNKDLEKNILETIGCDYELIVINNSNNIYSIFEAYNIGISRSQTSFLVFIHEDVVFHTMNWGIKLLQLFEENPQFGLIGVAGSKIKTKTPSGWWDCETHYKLVNIIQHFDDGNIERQRMGFKSNNLEEAAVIDGVFLAYRKLKNVGFINNFEGFHGYDLNLCFEVFLKGFKIGVTDLILIEHYSIGTINKDWLRSIIKIHDLYKYILPLKVIPYGGINDEIFSIERLLNKLIYFKERKLFIRYWFKLLMLKPNSKYHRKLIKTILKKMI